MKVTTYGTRGSCPVSSSTNVRYGGNTTCLRIESDCIPEKTVLVVDAGTGFLPCSKATWKDFPNVALLFTHYHHDHTQGFPLATHTYLPHAKFRIWGPVEHKDGPLEQLQRIMEPPQFPVPFEEIRHRIKCTRLECISTEVLIVHPKGGFALVKLQNYEEIIECDGQVTFGKERHSIRECMVIKMLKTVHPEYTVSYRFEERPTGKVFVFLTDHENTASLPQNLLRHLSRADLLIQDGQYSEEMYRTKTAGFGHGTPQYCVETALKAHVRRLGITHHDPNASDSDVDQRAQEAVQHAKAYGADAFAATIFACADYEILEV